jgi:magnesium transporter
MLRARGAGGHGRRAEVRPAAERQLSTVAARRRCGYDRATRKTKPRIMLVNCAAYQEGRKLADIPKEDISEYVKRPNCFVWVALKDPDPSELDEMRDEFGLHELAVEDARQGHSRPKIEEYGDSLFAVVQTVEPKDGELVVGEVNIFVGPNYILSIRTHSEKGFIGVRARCEREPHLLKNGSGFVFYALVDAVVDRYFPVIDALETQLEQIEENIFVKNTARSNIESLYALKQKLMTMKHAVDPLLEATGRLCGGRVPHICEGTQAYFRDVSDHLQRIHSAIEGFREMQTTAIQVNLGMINLNETEVTKKLAGWAAIIAIPTLIAGIYGMNFKNMPEYDLAYGYPIALALMIGIDFVLYLWFRKIHWL